MKEAGDSRSGLCEAETQTDLQLVNLPMETSEAEPSPLTPGRSLTLDLTHRTSGYFSREQSFVSREHSFVRATPPRASRESTPLNSRKSRDHTPLSTHSTSRLPSLASYNGNPAAVVCECQGCPGNLTYQNGNFEDPEEYLETLDRKVSEIMNKDCSRRSSYHDLAKKDSVAGDMYGPLSLPYGRKRGVSVLQDLNHNPSGGGYLGPAPEGAIRFEEDGKASSSEGLDSSQEDLSHVWSDEDSDQYVLRRRR